MLRRGTFLSKCLKIRTEYSRQYSRWESDISNYELIQSSRQFTKEIPEGSLLLPPITSETILKVVNNPKQTEKFKKLEFLGDAYIEFVVTILLFKKYPNLQKKLLVELLEEIVSNKNLAEVSRRIGLMKDTGNFKKDFKRYADVFEAYFGGIALEAGLTTHFTNSTNNVWKALNKAMTFIEKSSKDKLFANKELNLPTKHETDNSFERFCGNDDDPIRQLTQLRNNRMKDLKHLFNMKPDDYERRFTIERLHLLGNSALKYFLTKLYSDNLNDFSVKNQATLRDSRMKDSKITFLTQSLLNNPSYSLFYSLFNKNKKKVGCKPNSSHIKQFLGYVIATHFMNSSDIRMYRLFELGWNECELLIRMIYFEDLKGHCRSRHRNEKYTNIIDPRILDADP